MQSKYEKIQKIYKRMGLPSPETQRELFKSQPSLVMSPKVKAIVYQNKPCTPHRKDCKKMSTAALESARFLEKFSTTGSEKKMVK